MVRFPVEPHLEIRALSPGEAIETLDVDAQNVLASSCGCGPLSHPARACGVAIAAHPRELRALTLRPGDSRRCQRDAVVSR